MLWDQNNPLRSRKNVTVQSQRENEGGGLVRSCLKFTSVASPEGRVELLAVAASAQNSSKGRPPKFVFFNYRRQVQVVPKECFSRLRL